MKRFTWLATAVALCALAAPVSAQDMPMRVGIIGGVNFADIGGDGAGDTDMKTGFDIGALAQFPLGMVLTFQPELHYSQWGFSQDLVGDTEQDNTLSYLHIPLLLRAGTPLAEGLDVDLLLGPYIGVPLACETEVDDAESDCEDPDTDFGLTLGAGFSWGMGGGDLLIDGRYNLGFSEHRDESDTNNQVIQVLVGFAFPFGGM